MSQDSTVKYLHNRFGKGKGLLSEGSIGVVLVAENRLLREALAKFIVAAQPLELAGAFAFSGSTVGQMLQRSADVFVIDFGGDPNPPMRLLHELRVANPLLRSLAIGVESDRELFFRAIRAGFLGYLLKDASASDVISAIKVIAAGGAVCSPSLCAELFQIVRQQAGLMSQSCKFGLTRREHQLLPLIEGGKTNKEIACQLNLSEQTVKNHVHNILRKVGRSDRFDLAGLCTCTERLISAVTWSSSVN